jgi:hypothetical protein
MIPEMIFYSREPNNRKIRQNFFTKHRDISDVYRVNALDKVAFSDFLLMTANDF